MIKFFKKLRSRKQVAAFFEAAENRNISVIKDLLESGFDVNLKHRDFNWPVILSVVEYPEILEYVILLGADINAQETNKWYSPLILATRKEIKQSVIVLLRHHADTHLTSMAGLPAIFYALELGSDEIVDMLLDQEDDDAFLKEVVALCKEKGVDISNYQSSIDNRMNDILHNRPS